MKTNPQTTVFLVFLAASTALTACASDNIRYRPDRSYSLSALPRPAHYYRKFIEDRVSAAQPGDFSVEDLLNSGEAGGGSNGVFRGNNIVKQVSFASNFVISDGKSDRLLNAGWSEHPVAVAEGSKTGAEATKEEKRAKSLNDANNKKGAKNAKVADEANGKEGSQRTNGDKSAEEAILSLENWTKWKEWYFENCKIIGTEWNGDVNGEALIILDVDKSGNIKVVKKVLYLPGFDRDGIKPSSDLEKQFLETVQSETRKVHLLPFPDNGTKNVQLAAIFCSDGAYAARHTLAPFYPSLKSYALVNSGRMLDAMGYHDLSEKLYSEAKTIIESAPRNRSSLKASQLIDAVKKTEFKEARYAGAKQVSVPLNDYFHAQMSALVSEKLQKNDYDFFRKLEETGWSDAPTNLLSVGNSPQDLANDMFSIIIDHFSVNDPSEYEKGVSFYNGTIAELEKAKISDELKKSIKERITSLGFNGWLAEVSGANTSREIREKAMTLSHEIYQQEKKH